MLLQNRVKMHHDPEAVVRIAARAVLSAAPFSPKFKNKSAASVLPLGANPDLRGLFRHRRFVFRDVFAAGDILFLTRFVPK